MTASPVPDLADVLAARQRIGPYLQQHRCTAIPALDATTGAALWVKHENHQPVGAFKVRGGVNLVSQLDAENTAGASSPPRRATTASRWPTRRTSSASGR